jgi:hypothetical protein
MTYFSQHINGEPYFQSRHRGQFIGALNSAPGEVVLKVRMISRKLIIAFIKYLFAEEGLAYEAA